MYSRLLPKNIKLCYYTQKHFRRNLIMEPLFVAEWKYDKKTIYELIPLFRKNSVLSSTATFAVPLFIVLFFCFPHENGLFDGSGIFLLSVAAFFALCHIFEPRLRIRMFFKSYKNCFSEQGNLQAAFFDDELKLQISDGKVESSAIYPYSTFRSVTETHFFYCFFLKIGKQKYVMPIMKDSFVKGNKEDFHAFLKDKYLL